MRKWKALSGGIGALLSSGCTAIALQHSTIAVSTTVATILEQQALDNVGRFYAEKDAVPSLVMINTGTITIQNKAIPTYKLPFAFADRTKASKEADLGLEMDWQEAWTTVAILDSTDLTNVRRAFKVIVQKSQTGTCDIARATDVNSWLCVDPIVTPMPSKAASDIGTWWVHKGSYHGHDLWVANSGFIDFVVSLGDLQKKSPNLFFAVPTAPALQ